MLVEPILCLAPQAPMMFVQEELCAQNVCNIQKIKLGLQGACGSEVAHIQTGQGHMLQD